MAIIKLYHASNQIIENPEHDKSRPDTDFGCGFYMSSDLMMAKKWAFRKKPSIINEYKLDTNRVQIYQFQSNKEWLEFVINNRQMNETDDFYNQFDLLVGPTADDKLYSTIEQYELGFINADTASRIIDCMKIGEQYVFKTNKIKEALCFSQAFELDENRKQIIKQMIRKERDDMNNIVQQILWKERENTEIDR